MNDPLDQSSEHLLWYATTTALMGSTCCHSKVLLLVLYFVAVIALEIPPLSLLFTGVLIWSCNQLLAFQGFIWKKHIVQFVTHHCTLCTLQPGIEIMVSTPKCGLNHCVVAHCAKVLLPLLNSFLWLHHESITKWFVFIGVPIGIVTSWHLFNALSKNHTARLVTYCNALCTHGTRQREYGLCPPMA